MARKRDLVADALDRVRGICLALPEATERLSHGSPTFFVRDKTTCVMFLDNHHGDARSIRARGITQRQARRRTSRVHQ